MSSSEDYLLDDLRDTEPSDRFTSRFDERALQAASLPPALPGAPVCRIAKPTEEFPVERHAASVVRGREVGIANTAFFQRQRLLIGVVDASRLKSVGEPGFDLERTKSPRSLRWINRCSKNRTFFATRTSGGRGSAKRFVIRRAISECSSLVKRRNSERGPRRRTTSRSRYRISAV